MTTIYSSCCYRAHSNLITCLWKNSRTVYMTQLMDSSSAYNAYSNPILPVGRESRFRSSGCPWPIASCGTIALLSRYVICEKIIEIWFIWSPSKVTLLILTKIDEFSLTKSTMAKSTHKVKFTERKEMLHVQIHSSYNFAGSGPGRPMGECGLSDGSYCISGHPSISHTS